MSLLFMWQAKTLNSRFITPFITVKHQRFADFLFKYSSTTSKTNLINIETYLNMSNFTSVTPKLTDGMTKLTHYDVKNGICNAKNGIRDAKFDIGHVKNGIRDVKNDVFTYNRWDLLQFGSGLARGIRELRIEC